MSDPMRVVFVDDVVTLPEAAERLGLNINSLRRWHQREAVCGFPPPLKRSCTIILFSLEEIEVWHKAHLNRLKVIQQFQPEG
jgi:hypothetical protein